MPPGFTAGQLDALRVEWKLIEAVERGFAAVRQAPGDSALRIALGRALLARHRYDAALETFTDASRLAPDDGYCVAWQIAALSRLRRYQDGLSLGESATARSALVHRSIVHVATGRLLLDAERPDEALASFRAAAAGAAGDLRVQRWLTVGLTASGQWSEADDVSRQLLAANDALAAAHVIRGHLLLAGEAHADAYASFERALAIDPVHHAALKYATEALRREGRLDDADELITYGVEQIPGSPALLVEHALVDADRARWDDALAQCARALSIDDRHPGALVARIDLLRLAGRTRGASAAAEAALEYWPEDPGVHLASAAVDAELGRSDRALHGCATALRLAPRRRSAILRYISLSLRFEHLDEGINLAERSLASMPGDTDIVLLLARLHARRGDVDLALDYCKMLLARLPDDAAVLTLAITLLRRSGKPLEAAEMARGAAEAFPADTTVQIVAARAFAAAGAWEDAASSCDAALRIKPASRDAWQLKLAVFRRSRQPNARIEAAERAVSLLGEDPDVLVTLADAYTTMRQHRTALSHCDRALAVDPQASDALRLRVLLLRQLRRFDDAERQARAAISDLPENPDLHLALAQVLAAVGRTKEALTCCEEALDLDPGHDEALDWCISWLLQAGRHDEAERRVRTELARRPTDPCMRLALVRVLDARGKTEDALARCEEILEVDQRYVPALLWRVRTLHRMGQHAEARKAADAALAKAPADAEILLVSGVLYDDRLKFSEALKSFDEALRLDSSSVDTYLAKAATYRAMREWTAASRTLDSLVSLVDDESIEFDVLTARAWIYHDMRCIPDGRQIFGQLLRMARSPEERAAAAHGLGWIELSDQRFEEAESRFRDGLRLVPGHPQCVLGLAWTLTKAGTQEKLADAVGAVFALAERDHDPAACVCLGVAYFKQEEWESALYWLKEAVRIDPIRGSDFDLGALYARLGLDDELAERHLRLAIERDGFNAAAHIEVISPRLIRASGI